MENEQIVTAIDIGTTKIVAMAGKRDETGKVTILGVGKAQSLGVKRGVVLNIEETASAIQKAVEEAQRNSGVTFKEVYVGIAGQHIKSIHNRGYKFIDEAVGEITLGAVESLTNDMFRIPIGAGEEIIHVIPQNYIVDHETGVKNPVGMSCKRLEADFHIVVGQVASARNIKKCVERIGLKVIKLILEPLASAEAVLSDDEKEAGVALVDIGGGTTDIAIFHDGIIRHTAVIPFGGNIVTKDIKEGCSILARFAETLKIQFGMALAQSAPEDKFVSVPGISGRGPKEISVKFLTEIIQARMEEIIDAINFEIDASGIAGQLGAGVALTGGGSQLRDLCELFRLRTGQDVHLGKLNADKINRGGKDESLQDPIYSTSIGLLLKGFAEEDQLRLRRKANAPELAVAPPAPLEEVHEELPADLPEAPVAEAPAKKTFIVKFKEKLIELFEDPDQRH